MWIMALTFCSGLLVTVLILHQAFELLSGSLHELTDAGISSSTVHTISTLITSQLPTGASVRDVRGIRRGAHIFVDATVDVDVGDEKHGSDTATSSEAKANTVSTLGVRDMVRLEDDVRRAVQAKRKEVKEIRLLYAYVTR